tara:strand:+ start:869 stop:1132 length:264 start_codon:yes stop_codon:yes gene_type:complete
MDKIYRGAKNSINKETESNLSAENVTYRGSNSLLKEEPYNINKDELTYRGVSKDTTYYTLAKIRAVKNKRKLFYSGLELSCSRKYCY